MSQYRVKNNELLLIYYSIIAKDITQLSSKICLTFYITYADQERGESATPFAPTG